jgi:hypothetical protein
VNIIAPVIEEVAAPIVATLKVSGASEAVELLVEGMPVLMKALDAAQQAHPVIAGNNLG